MQPFENGRSKVGGRVMQPSGIIQRREMTQQNWIARPALPHTAPLLARFLAKFTLDILPAGDSGQVAYTINPISTVTTGTSIGAAARVIYDKNMPQDTNTVTNQVDAVAPTTNFQVTDLGNGQYNLSWQATDDAGGSGVANSDVYVTFDGVTYQIADQYDDSGSFTYTAPPGAPAASFLVLSADNAGNVGSPVSVSTSFDSTNPNAPVTSTRMAISLASGLSESELSTHP